MSTTLQGLRQDPALYEDYRYVHSHFVLRPGWKDALKMLWGALFDPTIVAKMHVCVRLCIHKELDTELEQNGPGRMRITDDLYSARCVIMKRDEAPKATSKAIFSYDELHNKGEK